MWNENGKWKRIPPPQLLRTFWMTPNKSKWKKISMAFLDNHCFEFFRLFFTHHWAIFKISVHCFCLYNCFPVLKNSYPLIFRVSFPWNPIRRLQACFKWFLLRPVVDFFKYRQKFIAEKPQFSDYRHFYWICCKFAFSSSEKERRRRLKRTMSSKMKMSMIWYVLFLFFYSEKMNHSFPYKALCPVARFSLLSKYCSDMYCKLL